MHPVDAVLRWLLAYEWKIAVLVRMFRPWILDWIIHRTLCHYKKRTIDSSYVAFWEKVKAFADTCQGTCAVEPRRNQGEARSWLIWRLDLIHNVVDLALVRG